MKSRSLTKTSLVSRTLRRLLTGAALVVLLASCSNADEDADGEADGETATAGEATGTVAVNVEPVEGFFTEGFEIGLRFETLDGERLAATQWTDAVAAAGDGSPDSLYRFVLDQEVPAGPVAVLATVNIGIGPPPEKPDLDGDLRCRVEVEVPDGARVEVEVSFTDRDCLRLR